MLPRATVSMLAAALLGGACDDDPAPAAPPAAPAADPPAAPAVAPAPAPYQHRPGPAYLGVDGAGLFRLDPQGTLTRLVDHRFPFQQIAVDESGVVYAAAIGGMWRIEGARISRLEESVGMPYRRLAFGPDGVLWATDQREVSRYDGAWAREPSATFDGALLYDLAVDLDGRVWVLTSDILWRLDGDRWNRLDTSFAPNQPPHFRALAVDLDGTVLASSLGGISRFVDGRWSDAGFSMGRVSGLFDELVTGPAGHVVASGSLDTVVVAAPGAPMRRTEMSDGPARAVRGNVLAVDGAGRLWITTDNGLVILDEHGDLLQQWEPGTVAGITGKITALTVVADGPALPAQRPAVTGTVTGRAVRRGKPVPGASVELCDMPMISFQRTPCEHATFSRLVTADAAGRFRFDAIPVGSYGFAVKPDEHWRTFIESEHDCCTQLETTNPFDVGAIRAD